MSASEHLLIVEDEEFVRASMSELLTRKGFRVSEAGSAQEADDILEQGEVDVLLTDLRLPGRDGIELLRHWKGAAIPTVIITGHGTVGDAVKAMKEGAYDFVQKPVDPDELFLVVQRAAEHGRLVREVSRLRASVDRLRGARRLVGRSQAMESLRGLIARVAPTDATVLVTGESGTGKELVAQEIHHASGRADGPLVQVNCAAVVANLFESEFFGHRRGAFSGAEEDRDGRFLDADGGTLVLDEIETLSVDGQAKLLRVLESGEVQRVGDSRVRVVDVRVVAVTNEDLAERVSSGTFRADLYHRLHVFPIDVPPLRAHLEDLPELVTELVARAATRTGSAVGFTLEAEALAFLASYDWPGNVRELRNVLERAAILAPPGGRVDAALLRDILSVPRPAAGPERAPPEDGESLNLRARLETFESELLTRALEVAQGNKKEASRLLGIDPKNLSYYLNKHDLGRDGGGRS